MQEASLRRLQFPWHIFEFHDQYLRSDYKQLTKGRISDIIPESVQVIKSTNIILVQGATLTHCMLNASTGPIYIGKDAEIMEGATIRGPCAMLERSVVKMGAKIYGATTIGPYC